MAKPPVPADEPSLPTDEPEPMDEAAQEGDAEAAPIEYSEDDPNLVEAFMATPEGKKALKEISDKVLLDRDVAWESTEVLRKKFADNWKFVTGDLPPKTAPFTDCANAHVPIMLENLMRLVARTESEVFNDWNQIFNVMPVKQGDEEVDAQAEIMTQHDNWQLREKIPDFKRQMSRATMMFYFAGDLTTHSYYHTDTKNNCHEVLTPDDFIVPFQATDCSPDWSGSPFRIKIQRTYKHELEQMRDVWFDVDKVIDGSNPTWSTEPEKKIADSVAKSTGVDPDNELEGQYVLYWYEGWLDLPNQDRRRFCQAVVEPETRCVLQLQIYEEADWQDQLRFESQMGQMETYKAQSQLYTQQQASQEQQIKDTAGQAIQMHSQGQLAPLQGEVVQQGLDQALQIHQSQQPPEAPPWMDPNDPNAMPDPVRKVPIQLFGHSVCIEPLAGNRGLGYGNILGDLNRGADTALSQFIDMATFGNVPGFIAADVVEVPGDFTLSPMKITKISGVSPAQLKDALIPIKPDAANPQLMQLVQIMQEWGQEAAQAPNVLSGEPGKSGETKGGIAIRVDQATKQMSVAARKLTDHVIILAKNNAKLNSKFLPEEEVVNVTDPLLRQSKVITIGRKMWERDYNVEMRCDLRFTSQSQKIQEADELLGLTMKIPQLAMNPMFMFLSVKKVLESRGHLDMVQALGGPQAFAPPPPPPVPPGALPPHESPTAAKATPPVQKAPPGAPNGREPPAAPGPHP